VHVSSKSNDLGVFQILRYRPILVVGWKKSISFFFVFFSIIGLLSVIWKNWSMGSIFSTHFFGIFIVHLLYQGMRLETLNRLISKVVFWTTQREIRDSEVIFSRNYLKFTEYIVQYVYSEKMEKNPNFQIHPSHCFCLVAPHLKFL